MNQRLKFALAAVMGISLLGVASPASASSPASIEPASASISRLVEEDLEAKCSGCGYGTTVTKLGSTRVNGRHVQNLTGSWAKASQYTWAETVTTTATLSADVGLSAATVSSAVGATYSTSKGFSVSTVIPANNSRYSKLALKANFDKVHVRVVKKAQGITTSDRRSYLYSPVRGSQTLYVNYR